MAAIPTPPNDEPVGHDYELRAWDELLADLEERPLADGLQSQPRERPNLTLIEGGDDPMPTAPKTRADLLEYLDWQERWAARLVATRTGASPARPSWYKPAS